MDLNKFLVKSVHKDEVNGVLNVELDNGQLLKLKQSWYFSLIEKDDYISFGINENLSSNIKNRQQKFLDQSTSKQSDSHQLFTELSNIKSSLQLNQQFNSQLASQLTSQNSAQQSQNESQKELQSQIQANQQPILIDDTIGFIVLNPGKNLFYFSKVN